MSKNNILVLDVYEAYAHRLRTALDEVSKGEYSVFFARNADGINETINNYTVHVLIVGEEWKRNNTAPSISGALVFVLSDEANENSIQDGVISRTVPIDKTVLQLVHLMNNSSKIIGVTGVGGGCGKTTVAMALAIYYMLEQKKVFFLSLETYMANLPFTRYAAHGFAEVMTALDEPTGLKEAIEKACVSTKRYNSIETFAISERNVDRAELTSRDIEKLLTALRNMGRWDIIIVDMEGRMDDVLFAVWQRAAKMVMMIPESATAFEKLKIVEQELEFRQRRGEAESNKILPVFNLADGEPKNVKLLGQQISIRIPDLVRLGADMKKYSSEGWCEMLGTPQVRQFYYPVYDEVNR